MRVCFGRGRECVWGREAGWFGWGLIKAMGSWAGCLDGFGGFFGFG